MNLDRVLELARLHPDEVFTLPCVPNTVRLVRAGRAHPDEAHMTIAVPDEWVKQLRGAEELRPLLFCLYISRRLVDLAETRLVLPQETRAITPVTPRRRRKP